MTEWMKSCWQDSHQAVQHGHSGARAMCVLEDGGGQMDEGGGVAPQGFAAGHPRGHKELLTLEASKCAESALKCPGHGHHRFMT